MALRAVQLAGPGGGQVGALLAPRWDHQLLCGSAHFFSEGLGYGSNDDCLSTVKLGCCDEPSARVNDLWLQYLQGPGG